MHAGVDASSGHYGTDGVCAFCIYRRTYAINTALLLSRNVSGINITIYMLFVFSDRVVPALIKDDARRQFRPVTDGSLDLMC